MYLVAHQDDCNEITRQHNFPIRHYPMDTIEHAEATYPCTCEPQRVNWERLLLAIAGAPDILVGDLYE